MKQIQNIEFSGAGEDCVREEECSAGSSVGVSYGYRGALMPDRKGTKALNIMNFEVGFSLPVFFGSRQQKMIDESDFMARAANEQYGTVLLSLYSGLRSTYADVEAQAQLIPLYSKELIPQYEATYNSPLSSYSVGRRRLQW